MVRLRQILDTMRHRLQAIPLALVLFAIVLSQITLEIDGRLDGDGVPDKLETTVDSARTILAAIAGGLITGITLLLSLMLLAVQLATSQFSPRTLRNWTGDRTQQVAIGLVLGTAVYCLLVLRETRTLGENTALVPHVSVITGVLLGIVSLGAVVRSVDVLANRLRVGSVARAILDDTLAIVHRGERLQAPEDPVATPAVRAPESQGSLERPDDAVAVESAGIGWIQQIDVDGLVDAIPEGADLHIEVAVGAFVYEHQPLAWISPAPDGDQVLAEIRARIAIGDTRTMQEDVGFGIVQLVDVALRALSPGINDPNTAADSAAHLGAVLLALWEREDVPQVVERDGRRIVRAGLRHEDYLDAVVGPLRVHGAGDPQFSSTLIRVLGTVRRETARRGLPGPTDPLDAAMDSIRDAVRERGPADCDLAPVEAAFEEARAD